MNTASSTQNKDRAILFFGVLMVTSSSFIIRFGDQEPYALAFVRVLLSGILSLITNNPEAVAKKLLQSGIVCTARGGLLRVSPHCYNTKEEMRRAAEALNAVVNESSSS